MRRKTNAVILWVCLCMCSSTFTQAQFERILYPVPAYSSQFQSIDMDDSGHGIAVGTCGVIAMTNDNGVTWTFSDGPDMADYGAVRCVPGTDCGTILLAAEDSVYKSTDYGATWTSQALDYYDPDEFFFLDGGITLLLSDSDRIFRSTDNGENWAEVSLPDSPQADWLQVGQSIFTSINLDAGYTVIRSDDAGDTWNQLFTYPNYFGDWAFADENNGLLYTSDRKLWRTTDGGVTYALVTDDPTFQTNLSNLKALGGDDYLLTHITTGVYISEDHGVTWTQSADASTGDGTRVNYVKVIDDEIWMTSNATNIIRSQDGGRTFEDMVPAKRHRIQAVDFMDDNHGVAIGTGSTIYRTDDGGDSWHLSVPEILLSDYYTGYDIDLTPSGDIVACWSQQGPIISTDNGVTWTDFLDSEIQDSVSSVLFYEYLSSGREIATSGTQVIYRDPGESWQFIALEEVGFSARCLTFYNNQVGLLGGTNATLYRTTDGGESWSLLPLPSSSGQINAVVFISADEFIASLGTSAYKTFDGGESWENLGAAFPTGFGMASLDDGTLLSAGFASGNNGSFHHSADGGSTWSDIGYICAAFRHGTLTPSEKYFFAVGDGSIITRYEIGELVSVKEAKTVENSVAIYPNPTSGLVQVQLPEWLESFSVQVTIFDIRGQVMYEDSLDNQPSTTLDLALLSSGIYVLQVKGDDWVTHNKIVKR